MNISIKWNKNAKLIIADVDETIADVYTEATDEMVSALNNLLVKDIVLFLVSGGGLLSIKERVTDKLRSELRKKVLIAHCSGAEVWGFDDKGNIDQSLFYGLYDQKMTKEQKLRWREIIDSIIKKYQLRIFPTMPRDKFVQESEADPLSVMLADRGPQITLEFTNSIDLSDAQKDFIEQTLNIKIPVIDGKYDLRNVVIKDLQELYNKENLPVAPKLAGVFALDNPLTGVDKTYAIRYVLEDKDILSGVNLPQDIEFHPEFIEIWGDKFAEKGGSDFLMCRAVDKNVRTIDFRKEDPSTFTKDYNIVLWNGKKHLHEGLLEYLQSAI